MKCKSEEISLPIAPLDFGQKEVLREIVRLLWVGIMRDKFEIRGKRGAGYAAIHIENAFIHFEGKHSRISINGQSLQETFDLLACHDIYLTDFATDSNADVHTRDYFKQIFERLFGNEYIPVLRDIAEQLRELTEAEPHINNNLV